MWLARSSSSYACPCAEMSTAFDELARAASHEQAQTSGDVSVRYRLALDGLPAPAPDCVAPCTKLLQPQQKVVVGAPYYAFHSVTASATATGFGAQFSVRYSPDGNNYTTVYQTPTATTNAFKAIFNMPGYYRVVAVNTALSLLTTSVSVNITVS